MIEAVPRRSVALRDLSAAATVRAAARECAARLGFSVARIGEVDLVVTEAAKNAVLHGEGGQALVGTDGDVVHLSVLDSGPGMSNLQRCVRDGFSTAGTPGHGLGTILRLSTAADIATAPDAGTVIDARLAESSDTKLPLEAFEVGTIVRAHPDESVSGDTIAVATAGEETTVMVIDGLGHGRRAHEVAELAVAAFRDSAREDPESIVREIDAALRGVRGGVVGVAHIGPTHLSLCTLGNIDAFVLGPDRETRFPATHGTAGVAIPRLTTHRTEFGPRDVLVMHSDGLRRVRDPMRFPGLLARRASTISAVLFRDHERRSDDASVAVVRRRPQ